MKTIKNFLWYSLFIFLVMMTLGAFLSGEVIGGIGALLLALISNPKVRKMISQFGVEKKHRVISYVVVFLLSFFMIGFGVTPVEQDSQKDVSYNENETEKVEDKEESKDKEEDKKSDKEEPAESDKKEEGKIETETEKPNKPSEETDSMFDGYKIVDINACNLSGLRMKKVAVDIGYGDREYWAFTNEYGQLVKVVAKEIIPQTSSEESAGYDARYCDDEAKVSGTERSDLDEGHVIADSLGGVSNAYNITPQDSTLNRHGDQAYMEKVIRDAGGCTDFVAIITYPNTSTQIPSHYEYTYTLRGNKVVDSFDNVNPDSVPVEEPKPPVEEPVTPPVVVPTPPVEEPVAPPANPNPPTEAIVYWTPNGSVYHSNRSCPSLSRSKVVYEGTIAESGKSRHCGRC